MQISRSRIYSAIALFLITFFAISLVAIPAANAQEVPSSFQSISFINVAPNPAGVGQSVTVDFWLAVPLPSSELAANMTVKVTEPNGHTETLGPFNSDITGGTTTQFIPDQTGNYTFQMFYPGQTLTVGAYAGSHEEGSQSDVVTLVVQETLVGGIPFTPLPTSWWQTPVTAENVQNWAGITGPWLGLLAQPFAATGGYNVTGNYNPYTTGPTTGHILWTKPWAVGGVAGGDAGNTELSSYWGTSQYQPKWAPVVIDGIEYATWYTTTTGYNNGIVATDLYTGKTLWIINTTNPLRCGMQIKWESPNQYGVVGPYIWTTGTLPASDTGGTPVVSVGTQWNMYDALTGKYILSVVNGTSSGFLVADANGNLILYYANETSGTVTVHPQPGVNVVQTNTGPSINAWNMTMAIHQTGGQWSPRVNSVYAFSDGLMWSNPSIPTTIDGNLIGTNTSRGYSGLNFAGLTMSQCSSGVIVATYGAGTTAAPSVGETAGWLIEAGFSMKDGSLLWGPFNRTETPFTRLSENFVYCAGDGVYFDLNMATNEMIGYSLYTGKQLWDTTLTVNGQPPNPYDDYGIQNVVDSTNAVVYLWGLGGDIWAVSLTNGTILWSTTTNILHGDPGTETPYGIWPLWVQYGGIEGGGILYLSEGHEYSPPLFHGAQLLAINATDGTLVWKELAFEDTAAEISYGIITSFNSYDNQIYAYGKGPSATAVTAPDVGVTTATPVTIRGTVMDVSAGAKQEAVAANYPNGLPCVSDESESQWMEHVYEQQPLPANTTGVKVSIDVIDSNNNYRNIGTATSDSSGAFSFTWTPDIPGSYTVVATFAGSGAYYGSCAETSFYASEAPQTTPSSTPAPTSPVDQYFVPAVIGIIIAIIAVGAVVVLMLRKR